MEQVVSYKAYVNSICSIKYFKGKFTACKRANLADLMEFTAMRKKIPKYF